MNNEDGSIYKAYNSFMSYLNQIEHFDSNGIDLESYPVLYAYVTFKYEKNSMEVQEK